MLSKKDARILSELRQDARKKLTEISRSTGIPTSTIHERLKRFVAGGLRLTSVLNYPGMHMPLQCWVFVKAKARKKDALKAYLEQLVYVNVLLAVNSSADYVAECVFSTLKQQHVVLEELKSLGKVQVYPVIEEVGRELVDPLKLVKKRNI